jgi:pilus assembly protein Flp/PilA
MKPEHAADDMTEISVNKCFVAPAGRILQPFLCFHPVVGTKPALRRCNAPRMRIMIEYLKTWLELKTDRRGVTALEYGVIAGVLAVVVVTAFTTLGAGLNNAFTAVSNQL